MAKIDTLHDTFDQPTLDSSLWALRYGASSMTGRQLDLSGSSSYSGVGSVNTYDLTNSHACVLITPPGLGGGGRSIGMELALGEYGGSGGTGGVGVEWGDYGGSSTITAYYYTPGATSQTQIGYASVSATEPFWYRIRESSGTLYWDYSTDGASWTNFASDADTATDLALTSVYAVFFAGYYGTDTTFNALYSNFNDTPPPAAPSQPNWIARSMGY